MNSTILLVIVGAVLAAARPDDDLSKYDNFDIDEIIQNIRLLKSYANCFTGSGKCTAEGSDLKRLIPDSVQSQCGKCSEKQKELVAKVILAIQEKLAAEWDKLNNSYNPDNKYADQLKEFLDKYGH